ncbi:MAG: CHAT domain-containing protein [Thermoanaerobaculia bacterium]
MGLRSYRLALGTLLAGGLLATGATRWLERAPKASEPTSAAELALTLGRERPLEPRLTGFERWQPTPGHPPAPNPLLRALTARLDRSLSSSQQRSSTRGAAMGPVEARERNPGRTHLRGLAGLLTATRPTDLTSAIAWLAQAARSESQSAALWSDLAAAYLERGRLTGQPDDQVHALGAAERALALEPRLPAARFNRALALAALGCFRSEAVNAFREAAEVEVDPAWRQEDLARAEALLAQTLPSWNTLVRQFRERPSPEAARALATRSSFEAEQWAERELLGNAPGEEELRLAESLGEAVRAVSSDSTLLEEITLVRTSGGEEESRLLARGHGTFAAGLGFYHQVDIDSARPLFERAERDLIASGSPLALWARFYRAVCQYFAGDVQSAKPTFQALLREGEGRSLLQAQSQRMLGLLEEKGVQLDSARESYQANARRFEALGCPADAGFQRAGEARVLMQQLRPRQAWRALAPALRTLELWPGAKHQRSVLDDLARYSRELAEPLAARAFDRAALAAALRGQVPLVVVEALAGRAREEASRGERAAARESLSQARSLLATIPSPVSRELLETQVLVAEVALGAGGARELERLGELIAGLERQGDDVLLPPVLGARALLLLDEGRATEARAELERAFSILRQSGRGAESGARFSAAVAQARDVFDQRVRLALELDRDPLAAFREAEQARSLEFSPKSSPRVPPPQKLATNLPPGTLVLAYWSLEDRLLLWSLSKARGVRLVEVPLSRRDLATAVSQARRALTSEAPRGEEEETLTRLGRELLGPVASELAEAERLLVVPDRELFALPFAALPSPKAGEPLVQSLVVAKSAQVPAQVPADWPAPSATAPGHVLVVGNPAFDPAEFPDLEISSLEDAATEAKRIAATFPGSALLVGTAATPERLVEELPSVGIFHFAGHTLSNNDEPERAALLLAPGGKGSGQLTAQEIERLELPRLRLAVLASCGSAWSAPLENGGALGLARAFLAAGARQVVATLWSVDDPPTRRLLARFYLHLQQGADPPLALSLAQREAQAPKTDPDGPLGRATWAGFEVYWAPAH